PRVAVDHRVRDGELDVGEDLAGDRVDGDHVQRDDPEIGSAAGDGRRLLVDGRRAVRQRDGLIRVARDGDWLTVDDEVLELRAARDRWPAARVAPGHHEVGRDPVARDGEVHV